MIGFKFTNSHSFVAPPSEFKRNEGHFQMLNNWISLSLKNITFSLTLIRTNLVDLNDENCLVYPPRALRLYYGKHMPALNKI